VTVRVLLADDQTVVRTGFRTLSPGFDFADLLVFKGAG
jgi:hypothetical protein